MYTKEEQLKKVKKKKVSTFGRKNILKKKSQNLSKDEKDYLDWLQNQSYVCFVCGQQNGIEWHHVKKFSSDKKNHFRLIPLCFMHHRISNELSAHGTPRKFREAFTYEEQLFYAAKIHLEYLKNKLNFGDK